MRLALYQPDIPQNTGTILRMAACLGVGVDIIGPAGFDMSDRALRRAGLDYLAAVDLVRHPDWHAFLASIRPKTSTEDAPDANTTPALPRRLVLLTTKAEKSYVDFAFRPDDCLLLGRESAGAPEHVHDAADAELRIPLKPGLRSLNIAIAAAIVVGEALRQTGRLPGN